MAAGDVGAGMPYLDFHQSAAPATAEQNSATSSYEKATLALSDDVQPEATHTFPRRPPSRSQGKVPRPAATAATISGHCPARRSGREKFVSWDRKACCCARSSALQAQKRQVWSAQFCTELARPK